MSFWDKFKFKRKPFPEQKSEVGSQKSETAAATAVREHTGDAFRILVKPLVTEKTARLASRGQYGFVVAADANKHVVADAVEAVYGVRPVAVNVSNLAGKEVRFGQKLGRRKHWKKAVVTLPEGKKIAVYEGV